MNFTVTTDFVYIRFHGLEGGAAHDYTRKELRPWAKFISEQAGLGRMLYIYFNNDINVRAPDNAKMLMQMIGTQAVYPRNEIGEPRHRGSKRAPAQPVHSMPRSRRLRSSKSGTSKLAPA